MIKINILGASIERLKKNKLQIHTGYSWIRSVLLMSKQSPIFIRNFNDFTRRDFWR